VASPLVDSAGASAERPALVVEPPAARPPQLAEHFDTLEQQHGANTLGMWIFLASELMLFGMLFTTYAAYRARFPDAFAEGSRHLDLTLGGINTAILIVSTLMMALAEHSAQRSQPRRLQVYLWLAFALGVAFLMVKGLEYAEHYREQLVPGFAFSFDGPNASQVALFFLFYYAMTGLHAAHLTAGLVAAGIAWLAARRGGLLGTAHWPLQMIGMYWNFVDIIWLFLLPLLYLAGPA
jgi:cytochrome c oxidase subunit 3